jgi:hypothetical protein
VAFHGRASEKPLAQQRTSPGRVSTSRPKVSPGDRDTGTVRGTIRAMKPELQVC